jgi:hypothetical protein
MKAFGLAIVLVAFLGTGFILQEKAEKAEKGTTTKTTVTTTYACPMHPDVKSEKEGKCPKCGMALAKVSEKVEKTVVKKEMSGCCGKCCAKGAGMKGMSNKAECAADSTKMASGKSHKMPCCQE